MADRRRSSNRGPTSRSAPRRKAGGLRLSGIGSNWQISPDVARSLVGVIFLVFGAVTLIALALPGQGRLTDIWRDAIAPWFGTGRWLLPFVLLGAGVYVERARGKTTAWELRLLGGAIAYTGVLGLIDLLDDRKGGRIGTFVAHTLGGLITRPGAFVVLIGILVAGLLIMFDVSLATLLSPLVRAAKHVGASITAPAEGQAGGAPERPQAEANGRRRAGATAPAASTFAAVEPDGLWDGERDRGDRNRVAATSRTGIPVAVPSPAPMSATFASATIASASGVAVADGTGTADGSTGNGPAAGTIGRAAARTDTDDDWPGARATPPREYRLPPLELLDDVAARTGDPGTDHARNAAIITAKLASFNIPARVDHWNAGPVVTQYEIEPAPEVKVSRIEALADDLSMALAARTLRIEAPIPGRSVVGIEIPNKDFNVVALRRIAEEPEFRSSTSRLTFALGRDVAGHARSVDLAKMPHLLIAGSTGSGKSVMVNALIASLLVRAKPNEVHLILMDLKRVELASYNGVPHLLVPVITEPERAKAALKWAVGEMENRYRRLAGATARNIAGYNETRVNPLDRLPYIVIVIDELADLMMREGRNVEDPIVRLAQKARATGIHMVLATQRPSVNVVTGLIKANFPSRIAFAMASQIDSRTILDAPGAEDLIGRGDMLYQPADLPRPMRLQGVFVSDKEIGRITDHWRSQDEPHYDLSIIDNDEESTGLVEDQPDEEADRLLPDAIRVVQEYDRASASLLQRRLKVGYARAARIIDQLEARGHIGSFDGSNARPVLRRDVAPGKGAARRSANGDDDDA